MKISKIKIKFIPFILCFFIIDFYACQKDDSTKKIEEPKEIFSYLYTVKNELDHSSHTYYYNQQNKIRRYIGEEYWSDFIYNEKEELIKEEEWNDEGSEIIGYKKFNYNSDGLIDTVDVYWKKEEEFQKVAIIIFEYNLQKQIVEETVYYPVVMQKKKMLYQYDEKGNQTRMEHYDVYTDTTVLTQYVTYEYDTCKNAYKGINYPFSYGLLKKTIHDYPSLSKVNNITRVNIFDWNDILYLYTIYDYQNYNENNYPDDFIKTIYNENGDVLRSRYYFFTYLEEELVN